MERLWLVLAIVAFFLLCLWGMYLGWRRKARSQSVRVPPFEQIPAEPGEALLESTGVYIATTIAGSGRTGSSPAVQACAPARSGGCTKAASRSNAAVPPTSGSRVTPSPGSGRTRRSPGR